MKSTGIIRRIDDLGRVVIPKEVRRVMRIKEGDPLEIFPTDNGIFLMKYDSTKTIAGVLQEFKDIVSEADELECKSAMLEKITELAAVLKAAQDKNERND